MKTAKVTEIYKETYVDLSFWKPEKDACIGGCPISSLISF